MNNYFRYFLFVLISILMVSCSVQKKQKNIVEGNISNVQLTLGKQEKFIPEVSIDTQTQRDTLTVLGENGKEVLLMKAIKDDETGEMVATDVLDAAKVTARFRNVAERKGKVDLAFQIMVPEAMMDSQWQIHFYPKLFMMGDSTDLDPVIITGTKYRKAQLKGYQQYNKFLSKIIQDSTRFVNIRSLEIFLKRNIPEIYAFRTDSSFVSENEFYSAFGVNKEEAIEHYTNKFARGLNERRKRKREDLYHRFVKDLVVTENIRLDSVIVDVNGDFVYNYVQTITPRPKLRKANIVISGEIYDRDKLFYTIPSTDSLTFYISSIAAFADNTVRYKTKVVERRAEANTECHIDFELGKSRMVDSLGGNAQEIRRIKNTLSSLIANEVYDLDSIIVTATASPEGSYSVNKKLAENRSKAVSDYFSEFIDSRLDSLRKDAGILINLDGSVPEMKQEFNHVHLTPRSNPENWEDLKKLVEEDPTMNVDQKSSFYHLCETVRDVDAREYKMRREAYYSYMKKIIYPKLRTVKFNFFLHRKGMVKDTVHTTFVDSTYMRGVQALKDMDYEVALELLAPYKDYNAAVAYVGLNRNRTALAILKKLKPNAKIDYLCAILYSRIGKVEKAVNYYISACRKEHSYVYRGNLDPEISELIKTYRLNMDELLD